MNTQIDIQLQKNNGEVKLMHEIRTKARKLAVDQMPDMHEFSGHHTGGVPVFG